VSCGGTRGHRFRTLLGRERRRVVNTAAIPARLAVFVESRAVRGSRASRGLLGCVGCSCWADVSTGTPMRTVIFALLLAGALAQVVSA